MQFRLENEFTVYEKIISKPIIEPNMSVSKKLITKAKWWRKFAKKRDCDEAEDADKKTNWLKESSDIGLSDELPADIQSRLICHVPDFVWSANVSSKILNNFLGYSAWRVYVRIFAKFSKIDC